MKKIILLFFLFYSFAYSQVDTAMTIESPASLSLQSINGNLSFVSNDKIQITDSDGGILLGNMGNAIMWGSGTPEGNVVADIGTIYLRYDGSTGSVLYVKETGAGNTGWVAK